MAQIKYLVVFTALSLGCSSGGSEPPPSTDGGSADARQEVLDSGAAEASCLKDNGALACDSIVTKLCEREVQCCNVGGMCNCASNMCSVTACKASLVSMGTNCAAPGYTNSYICQSFVTACKNDVPLMACSDLRNGTANWPATCQHVWDEIFPQ